MYRTGFVLVELEVATARAWQRRGHKTPTVAAGPPRAYVPGNSAASASSRGFSRIRPVAPPSVATTEMATFSLSFSGLVWVGAAVQQ